MKEIRACAGQVSYSASNPKRPCNHQGVIFVSGHWYCKKHNPEKMALSKASIKSRTQNTAKGQIEIIDAQIAKLRKRIETILRHREEQENRTASVSADMDTLLTDMQRLPLKVNSLRLSGRMFFGKHTEARNMFYPSNHDPLKTRRIHNGSDSEKNALLRGIAYAKKKASTLRA